MRGRMARNDYERLSAGDVKALLALMGELYELSHQPGLRDHLLRSIRRLTDARVATWARLLESRSGWRIEDAADSGWRLDHAPLNAIGADGFAQFCLDGAADPMRIISRRRGAVVTAIRHELIPDRDWYAFRHVAETRRHCGVDDCIYSLHRLRPGPGTILLSVHRA